METLLYQLDQFVTFLEFLRFQKFSENRIIREKNIGRVSQNRLWPVTDKLNVLVQYSGQSYPNQWEQNSRQLQRWPEPNVTLARVAFPAWDSILSLWSSFRTLEVWRYRAHDGIRCFRYFAILSSFSGRFGPDTFIHHSIVLPSSYQYIYLSYCSHALPALVTTGSVPFYHITFS